MQTNTADPASFKKDVLKRCANKEDYISAFSGLVRKNEDLREIEFILNKNVKGCRIITYLSRTIQGHIPSFLKNSDKNLDK